MAETEQLPRNLEAEKGILCEILTGDGAAMQVLAELLPSSLITDAAAAVEKPDAPNSREPLFSDPWNQFVFGACCWLAARGTAINPATVDSCLSAQGILSRLNGSIPAGGSVAFLDPNYSPGQIVALVPILISAWQMRAMVSLGLAIAEEARTGQMNGSASKYVRRFEEIIQLGDGQNDRHARRNLGQLKRPPVNDSSELIRYRFVCRKSVNLVAGSSGTGKSPFIMQWAISLALGKPLFGLEPTGPLRVVIVQAENDEGDLAEMRDGVAAGMGLTDEELAEVSDRVIIYTESSRTSDDFAALLNRICEIDRPDALLIDPAFAYIGGDTAKAVDVTHFMRHLLIPLAQRYNLAIFVVHHTNKPPNGKEKATWAAGDFAYLGAGSVEWCNASRAVLAIRSIGSDTVFELRAAKRGGRLRWVDDDLNPTVIRYIAHHRERGIICWRIADDDEVQAVLEGRTESGASKISDDLLRMVFAGDTLRHKEAVERIQTAAGCKRTKAAEALSSAVERGIIFKGGGFYALPRS